MTALFMKTASTVPTINIPNCTKRKAKQTIIVFFCHEVAGRNWNYLLPLRKKTEEIANWLSHLGLPSLELPRSNEEEDKQRNHKPFG